MPYKGILWATWKTILLRMYEKRVTIFETTSRMPPHPTSYRCDGDSLRASSVRALESRGFIVRRRNNNFRIVWHLTNMGRAAAKKLKET